MSPLANSRTLVTYICALLFFSVQSDLNNEPYCAEIAAGGCPKRSGVGECICCCYLSKNNVFDTLTLLHVYTL